MFGLNPYAMLGALVGALFLFGVGYWAGSDATANSYEAKIAKTREATQAIIDGEVALANAASAKLETRNAQSRVVYQTIHDQVATEVEKPVYLDRCVTDDGLRLINQALTNPSPRPSSEPSAAMPRSLTPP